MNSYVEVQDHIAKTFGQRSESGYTLDRMRQFMAYLGDPQNQVRSVHVAGTSGKTSTCYYLARLLQDQDFQVGLMVSPHVDTIAERSQINGNVIPEAEYCADTRHFLSLAEAFSDELQYFELMYAFGFWQFAKRGLDIMVIEVGVGGLVDTTNIIDRSDKICVITDIGLDHVQILGSTLPEIAYQKAGIILPKNTVFMHQQAQGIMEVVEQVAEQQSATLTVIDPDQDQVLDQAMPTFQQRNLHLALAVVSSVTHKDVQIAGAGSLYIPARMEHVDYIGKTIIQDGSHNEQKIAALVDSFKAQYGDKQIPLLVAFGRKKRREISESLVKLHEISDEIILTNFSYIDGGDWQSIDPHELAESSREAGFSSISVVDEPSRAFSTFSDAVIDVGLVVGSFYLLNHVRPVIREAEV